MKKIIVFSSLFLILVISACKKDPPVDMPSGTINFSFNNVVGDSALLVNNLKSYTNANNDTFSVRSFKYYISNVKLTTADGKLFVEPESYHLIDASSPSKSMCTINNVPFDNYTSVSFLIGVDSARNVSGAQTGNLDPANGMFWTWNTGYTMAELIGNSPQDTSVNHEFTYMILGYKGQYNVIKSVGFPFQSDTLKVTKESAPQINFKTDLAEWFKAPNIISIANTHLVIFSGIEAKRFADNYEDMFSIESIRN